MAEEQPLVGEEITLRTDRFAEILQGLERMAGGEIDYVLPISEDHDVLDAIAFAVNILVGEIRWIHERAAAQEVRRSAELATAKEAAEQASRAKTSFLRSLSHEIRTPLSTILLTTELLESSAPEAERRHDLIERIRKNGRVLLDLIQGVLDLAAIEAGRIEVVKDPFEPAVLAADVLGSVDPIATEKGLSVSLSGETDLTVLGDERHVRHILLNLIGNAVKFTAEGRVGVSIAHAGERLIVDVLDTGIGIAEDEREHLFQSFSQASPEIATRFGGTGLGLALSRRLAELLGGEISLVESEPDKGSTFRVSLPAPLAPRVDGQRSPPIDRPLGDMSVLLAEDNADLAEGLAQVLQRAGATVSVVGDGAAAIAEARCGEYDVVLMDLSMPVMGGFEAVEVLREDGYRGAIIAMTAYAMSDDRALCLSAGFDDYVTKPFAIQTLLTAMRPR